MRKLLFTLITLISLISCQNHEFKVSTTSMESTFKKGEIITIEPKMEIKSNDIIAFEQIDERFEKGVWIFRVIAVSGDVVEIKKGKVYVNKEVFNEPKTLKHSYYLNALKPLEKDIFEGMEVNETQKNQYIAYLTEEQLTKLEQRTEELIISNMTSQEKKFQANVFMASYENNWNPDNYGPLEIPYNGTEKQYFVLGDNRHNAIDSRYIGFVKEDQIVGVVK